MSDAELREKLQALHAELDRTDLVDAKTQADLRHLMRDIQDLLDRPGEQSDRRYASLQSRLRGMLLQVEVSHPHLFLNIERVLDAFNEMGI